MAVFPAEAELDALDDPSGSNAGPGSSLSASRCLPKSSRFGKESRSAARSRRRSFCRFRAAELAFLQAQALELPTLFIVSDVELRASGSDERTVVIERAGGIKCERCWRYVPSVSTDPAWAGLCDRCQDALAAHV